MAEKKSFTTTDEIVAASSSAAGFSENANIRKTNCSSPQRMKELI